ncbi:MAG: VCBS repeat-containing protein [Verrucomicrobia bacterium]|nr:VCBS repeat-containing protein [Verrucomicrobiota bacterium]
MKKVIPNLLFCLAALLLLAPQAKAQTTVLFESFENLDSFATNWVAESNYSDEDEEVLWGVVDRLFGGTLDVPRTGTNKLYCAAVRVDGARGWLGTYTNPRYQDNMSTVVHRDIDLQKYKSATLTFWYKARIFPGNDEEFDEFFSDYLTVYVDDDPLFSTDDLSEPVTKWTKVTINLDQYAGTICNLKFEFESDFYGQEDGEAAGEGVYLDDILVTGYSAYRADYNKDGRTDLLFHNLWDGRMAVWYMTNYTQMAESVLVRDGLPVPLGWRLSSQADFDGDGNADLLWHHVDGRLSVWFMDGGDFIKNTLIRRVGDGWRLMSMADFNHDGSQDFVWQHTDRRVAVWYMDGTNFLSSALIDKLLPTGVNVVASGDFNYDGRRDLLIQKKSTGKIWSRQLLGTKFVKDVAFTYAPGLSFAAEWRVAGTHDMNGDGDPDLLMRHVDGNLAAWILDGSRVVQQIPIRKAGTQWINAGHR